MEVDVDPRSEIVYESLRWMNEPFKEGSTIPRSQGTVEGWKHENQACSGLKQIRLLIMQVKTSQTLTISCLFNIIVQYVERLWYREVVSIAGLSSGPENRRWGHLRRMVWASTWRAQETPKRTSRQCWKQAPGCKPELSKGSDLESCGVVSSSPEQSSCQRWVTVHMNVSAHPFSPLEWLSYHETKSANGKQMVWRNQNKLLP